jgi:hypothetical protein
MKDESKKELLLLSKEQVAAIHEAQEQIANGQYLTDAEVRKRTSQWLGFFEPHRHIENTNIDIKFKTM